MVDDRLVRDTFNTWGVVAVRSAFSANAAAAMKDVIWNRLHAQTTARRDAPASWSRVVQPSFKPLKRRSEFHAVNETPAIRASLDAIFGERTWQPSGSGVQVLMTFPNAETWVLPHHLWHMDAGFASSTPTTIVRAFCCVDVVERGGGGTLALAGSHRLVDRYHRDLSASQREGNSASWRRFLNTDPWTRELIRPGREPERTRRLMDADTDVDGVGMNIVEMIGEPGDVYLTTSHIPLLPHRTRPSNHHHASALFYTATTPMTGHRAFCGLRP